EVRQGLCSTCGDTHSFGAFGISRVSYGFSDGWTEMSSYISIDNTDYALATQGFPMTVHQVFPVNQGDYTFYLNLSTDNIAGYRALGKNILTLIYFPSAYGTVTPLPTGEYRVAHADHDPLTNIESTETSTVDELNSLRRMVKLQQETLD